MTIETEPEAKKIAKSKSLPETAAFWLSIGLGVGKIPFAPGTFGSIWGLVIVAGLHTLLPVVAMNQAVLFLLASAVLFFIGVPICNAGIRHFGKDDPGSVVWDELAVFPLVFCVVPWTWLTAILGFVLFRLFDIWKPWPIQRLEKAPKGWGVMIDDYAAGVYAWAALTGIWWFL